MLPMAQHHEYKAVCMVIKDIIKHKIEVMIL